MSDYILEMKDITKKFTGVQALTEVNLQVERGEIHALCGENGAGKSTLMNILSGVYPYKSYSGQIIYNGQECQFHQIKDSEEKGIVIIHQELALIPYLSIAENVFLGMSKLGKKVSSIGGKHEKKHNRCLLRLGCPMKMFQSPSIRWELASNNWLR